jgi:hypothetical protein
MTRVYSMPAEWLPVSIAPSDADLEVCVMDYDGIVHALKFPCQQDKLDGSMLRRKNASISSRRIGANGLRTIKSQKYYAKIRSHF